jgi:hypothetical protein
MLDLLSCNVQLFEAGQIQRENRAMFTPPQQENEVQIASC